MSHRTYRLLAMAVATTCLASLTSTATAEEGKKDKKGAVIVENWHDMDIPPAPSLSAEEALKTFKVAPGFKIEAVATDPALDNPVAIAFDPAGRLWVVQMTAYMPNVDEKYDRKAQMIPSEKAPTGKITVFEDTNNDGIMDTHTNFLEGLVMPRAIAFVKGGVLIAEPPHLLYCQDTDGDLVCDEKTIAGDYATQGNPEKMENGLLYSLDNWMYNARSSSRHRFVDGKLITEPTKSRGQWGITQDNYGRLYYGTNSKYMQNDWDMYDQKFEGEATYDGVYSIRITPGVNRGYREGFLTKDLRLSGPTAASGPAIYRGTALGEDFEGGYFVPEPAGNVVAYFKPQPKDKNSTKFEHQTYPDPEWGKREFLASTDERFRPVNITTGPDGALYIVDLYHGILQHKTYLTDEYLGKQIKERGLDQGNLKGRVYRIVPEDFQQPARPNLDTASSKELVAALKHRNGWWRDTAQRLLVERQDMSVVPDLTAILDLDGEHLAKVHALWTLHGLGQATQEVMSKAQQDTHEVVRLTGKIVKTGSKSAEVSKGTDPKKLPKEIRESFTRGQEVYARSCVPCHGPDGKGIANTAPPLAGSDWMQKSGDALSKVILHGLQGPITINGKVHEEYLTMPGHAIMFDDQEVADVLTYIRNEWGNSGPAVSKKRVRKTRKKNEGRTLPWKEDEL